MEKMEVTFQRFVTKEEEGKYLLVPFMLPKNIRSIRISYEYDRSKNIIDFGLNNGRGDLIGWSGSDRSSILVSETMCSPGFSTDSMKEGQWSVLLGAYKVQEEGVLVSYTAEIDWKELKIRKGDTHVHSCGSDGTMTTNELAAAAGKQGLDYLFITDHNNYAHNDNLHSTEAVTLIPGVEWTHYKGHAGMLGVKRPFQSFTANSEDEAGYILQAARQCGALLVQNHPFCSYCGWRWNTNAEDFDLIEVWNGALSRESNQKCLDWWDLQLKQGKRIAVTGGSDFHRFQEGRMLAMPCTCVYAGSNAAGDILDALGKGHSFITLSPDGPMMEMDSFKILPGDEVPEGSEVRIRFYGLKPGDVLYLIGNSKKEEVICSGQTIELVRTLSEQGYYRAEIRRKLRTEDIQIPVLIANPFYITGENYAES